MGSEEWLVLATKQAGGFHCHLAEDLVGGIDEMPLTFHVGSFGGKSLNYRRSRRVCSEEGRGG